MRRPALALLLGCLLLVAGASALDGYDYYQTIEYAGCDQSVYQQDIVIHRSTGTAYNETAGGLETWHIYVREHCREDYGDLRFTDRYGRELAYYLWPDHDSSSARFAVRLEGADEAGTLIVWYGNSTAATTSDGDATYPFFDQFDVSELDTGKWESSGSKTVSGGILTLTKASKIRSVSTFGCGYAVVVRAKIAPVSQNWVGWLNSPSGTFAIFQYITSSRCHTYFSTDQYTACTDFSNAYHTFEIRRGSSTTVYLLDGETVVTHAQTSSANIKVTCEIYTGSQQMFVDYCLVRTYSATPPAALTFVVLQPFPGCSNDPTDPDADGLYEDINGNARWDFQDITLFFQHLAWCEANQPVSLFDWNSNGRCDFDDVFRLWSNEGMI